MIMIYFKDGQIGIWEENKYTDYDYKKDVFVVLYNEQWVGIYNMDEIRKIIIRR